MEGLLREGQDADGQIRGRRWHKGTLGGRQEILKGHRLLRYIYMAPGGQGLLRDKRNARGREGKVSRRDGEGERVVRLINSRFSSLSRQDEI